MKVKNQFKSFKVYFQFYYKFIFYSKMVSNNNPLPSYDHFLFCANFNVIGLLVQQLRKLFTKLPVSHIYIYYYGYLSVKQLHSIQMSFQLTRG